MRSHYYITMSYNYNKDSKYKRVIPPTLNPFQRPVFTKLDDKQEATYFYNPAYHERDRPARVVDATKFMRKRTLLPGRLTRWARANRLKKRDELEAAYKARRINKQAFVNLAYWEGPDAKSVSALKAQNDWRLRNLQHAKALRLGLRIKDRVRKRKLIPAVYDPNLDYSRIKRL